MLMIDRTPNWLFKSPVSVPLAGYKISDMHDDEVILKYGIAEYSAGQLNSKTKKELTNFINLKFSPY